MWLMAHSFFTYHPLRGSGARSERAHRISDRLFPERPEARADLFGQELRLFPGGEVPALFQLVVVDELGIGPLRPVRGVW